MIILWQFVIKIISEVERMWRMNLLYCGDSNFEDGLIISILSILKHEQSVLNIYILTMAYETNNKKYLPVRAKTIKKLDKLVKKNNPQSFVKVIDITDIYHKYELSANAETRFTPYCMLRLYADLVDLPSKILYLDNDVVCMNSFASFYNIDNSNYELVGVLDRYGSWFFRKKFWQRDYINSGVLLLNLDLIKQTGLFTKAREMCQTKQMLMPDQSALNKLATAKKIVPNIYNQQKCIKKDTIFRHFTTTFKFFPKFRTQKIKPWDIANLHTILKTYEIDDILNKHAEFKKELNND